MKVYVDELPKNCDECVCYHDEDSYEDSKCNLTNNCVWYNKDEFFDCLEERHQDCPLQPIAEHDKQVKKEVVEFIDKCFEMQKYESIWINPDKTEFSCDASYAYEWWESFRKILLAQIEGESND